MINKLIQWFNRNTCKDCNYYHPENNVCQSKKCAACGCHPYVNWFDRHFCELHRTESESGNYSIKTVTNAKEAEMYPIAQSEDKE